MVLGIAGGIPSNRERDAIGILLELGIHGNSWIRWRGLDAIRRLWHMLSGNNS
jgi:hypothetical protein